MSFFKSLSRFVGLLTRTTALPVGAAPDGTPIHTVVFPDTGGAQIVDATGAVLNLDTSGGAGGNNLDVTDAGTATQPVAASVRHLLSGSLVGAPGIGVAFDFQAMNAVSLPVTGLRIKFGFSNVTSGAETIFGARVSVMNGGSLTDVLSIQSTGDLSPVGVGTQSLGVLGHEWQNVYASSLLSCVPSGGTQIGVHLVGGGAAGLITSVGPGANAALTVKCQGVGGVSIDEGGGGGVNVGTVNTAKVGFYGKAPIGLQNITALGVTAADILAALDACGLVKSV